MNSGNRKKEKENPFESIKDKEGYIKELSVKLREDLERDILKDKIYKPSIFISSLC